MAIAIPSPSPRTLLRVGQVRFLVLRSDLGGPAKSQGVDNSGTRRAVPLRLRVHLASEHLRWLLATGYFGGDAVAR